MNSAIQLVSTEKNNSILKLILNDHKSKNALSNKMIFALMNAISSACDDKSIKVIVIAANGNVFSAGHDLKEITEAREFEDKGDSFFKKLVRLFFLLKYFLFVFFLIVAVETPLTLTCFFPNLTA